MHAGAACRSRVYAEHAVVPVIDDLDNVRVSAYKDVRPELVYQLKSTRRITARIAPDMNYQYIFVSGY